MSDVIVGLESVDLSAVDVLLCDADGNLFGSEEPAFVASADVTNRFLAELGVDLSFTPEDLRRRAIGRNFRLTAQELADEAGAPLDDEVLDAWVLEEQRAVVAHLASILSPDPEVAGPLGVLGQRYRLALVSSSAQVRLTACLGAAGLDEFFPTAVRFSAEDSLPVPTSKPDPAIYSLAGRRLGVSGAAGLAVEDAASGVHSAVAAGFPTIGNLQFVAPEEREQRAAALREAGAAVVVQSWWELTGMLAPDAAGEAAPKVIGASR